MALSKNNYGYAIASQNYCEELSQQLQENLSPASASSLCEAKQKISWEAMAHLFEEINIESRSGDKDYLWHGHRVRAVDGTQVNLPASENILKTFPRRNSSTCETHYPSGQLFTALNLSTGQPVAARFSPYNGSERDHLISMLSNFNINDIALSDQGLYGARVWRAFEDAHQFFICRTPVRDKSMPSALKSFVASKRKEEIINWTGRDKNGPIEIKVRMIKAGSDRYGDPIVLVTNLLDKKAYTAKAIWKLYKRRWEVETFYGRIKELTQLEKFHAKSVNGMLQELFAHLFVLSLTAQLIFEANKITKTNCFDKKQFNFKNAFEVLRRYFYLLVEKISKKDFDNHFKELIKQITRITFMRQPGRKNPRVCKRSRRTWCRGQINKDRERMRNPLKKQRKVS